MPEYPPGECGRCGRGFFRGDTTPATVGKVATKADLAALEGRFEARLASAVDKMLLAQIAVGGVVVALVRLF